MTAEIDTLLSLAKQVPITGAAVHHQGRDRAFSPRAKSSELDLVSEIDLETEQVMVACILQERPDDTSPKKVSIRLGAVECVGFWILQMGLLTFIPVTLSDELDSCHRCFTMESKLAAEHFPLGLVAVL